MIEKEYYLSNIRAIIVGMIFILMGIGLSTIPIDFNKSMVYNIKHYFSGDGFNIAVEILIITIEAGFIFSGILFLKKSKKIVRAKIDSKGLYYKPMPGKYEFLTYDHLSSFICIPFHKMKDIRIAKNFALGTYVEVVLADGKIKELLSYAVLKTVEKQEVVDIVKQNIQKQ